MNGMRSHMIYFVCVCVYRKKASKLLKNWSHTCRGFANPRSSGGYILVTHGKQFKSIVGLLTEILAGSHEILQLIG